MGIPVGDLKHSRVAAADRHRQQASPHKSELCTRKGALTLKVFEDLPEFPKQQAPGAERAALAEHSQELERI
ncbi:MAG: hypothetical protein R6U88_00465 [Candidatus Bipolaricaulota bacterium]